MKRIRTHYDNLKIARDAPPEVIIAAYKSLSMKYHPDKNPNNADAARIMSILNTAYEVLSDPTKRRKHDEWIELKESTEYAPSENLNVHAQRQSAGGINHFIAESRSFYNRYSILGKNANHIMQDLTVTAFGFLSCMLTALFLFLIEEFAGISLYSWTVWFIFPVGAIFSGFISASGYYFGSTFFGHKPTRLLLINMVLISVGTYFMIYWLSYVSLEVNGKSIHEYIPFSQYLNTILQHQTLTLRTRAASTTVSEVGKLGYLLAGLQIIGFAMGSIILYFYLSKLPFCDKCNKYLQNVTIKTRYNIDFSSLSTMANYLSSCFANGRLEQAIDFFNEYRQNDSSNKYYYKSSLQLKQCPECGVKWLNFTAHKFSNNDWQEIDELQFSRFHYGNLYL